MAKASPSEQLPGHAILKARHRAERAGWPGSVSHRIHRALSWLNRAEQLQDDDDTQFVLLWIGFNAAYAGVIGGPETSTRSAVDGFFDKLVALDRRGRLYDMLWQRYSHEIRLLLDNQYVFEPFWQAQRGETGAAEWERRLVAARLDCHRALARQDTRRILQLLFDRLYTLRNQIVHGGTTWGGSVNRQQVRDGARIMCWLLPAVIEVMMDHPDQDWGRLSYPVVD